MSQAHVPNALRPLLTTALAVGVVAALATVPRHAAPGEDLPVPQLERHGFATSKAQSSRVLLPTGGPISAQARSEDEAETERLRQQVRTLDAMAAWEASDDWDPADPMAAPLFDNPTLDADGLEYHFNKNDDDQWSAPNRDQRLRMTWSGEGLALEDRVDPTWRLDVVARSQGRSGGSMTPAPVEIRREMIDEARFERDLGALREWTVNRTNGVEYGVTIITPPTREVPGDTGLIVLQTAGLRAEVESEGRGVAFWSDEQVELTAGRLLVNDRRGTILNASFVEVGDGLLGVEYELSPHGVGIMVSLFFTRDDLGTGAFQLITPLPSPADFVGGGTIPYEAGMLADAGDVNGDGRSDLLVGAPFYDGGETNQGAAFLYLATATGTFNAMPDWYVVGGDKNQELGHSVAGAGDVNMDGWDDIIIGAPGWDASSLTNRGAAVVFHGSPTGPTPASPATPADADWMTIGPLSSSELGFDVSGARDIDDDGYDDVMVSAPLAPMTTGGTTAAGRVWAFRGSATGLTGTPASPANPDLVADWSIEPVVTGTNFGSSIAAVQNIDDTGDVYALIGAPLDEGPPVVPPETNEGVGYLFNLSAVAPGSGSITTPFWRGESNVVSARFGQSVAAAYDVNCDGYEDFIIGAPLARADALHPNVGGVVNTPRGAAYVWHGGPDGPGAPGAPRTGNANSGLGNPDSPNWFAMGPGPTATFFGADVTGLRQVGCNCSGVAIGASYFTGRHGDPGTSLLRRGAAVAWAGDHVRGLEDDAGPAGSLAAMGYLQNSLAAPLNVVDTNAQWFELGGALNDFFGRSVAGLADSGSTDAGGALDEESEIAVSAPGDDANGINAGAVYVFLSDTSMSPDDDMDGTDNCEDPCPRGNDAMDDDMDGVADACDECPGCDDTMPPTLSCPETLELECGDDLLPSVDPGLVPTAMTFCTAMPSEPVVCSEMLEPPYICWSDDTIVEGDCPNDFSFTRTWTLADDCGRETTCTQMITVSDSMAPALNLPEDLFIECEDEIPAVPNVSATDDCVGTLTAMLTNSATLNMTCQNRYTLQRTWMAMDPCGNTVVGTQNITVNDETAPELTVPDDATVDCEDLDPGMLPTASAGTASATDGCGDEGLTISWEDDFSAPCEASSREVIRTWTATDACGNSTFDTQTLTVMDTTPPALMVPDDATVDCADDIAPGGIDVGTATAEDSCGEVVELSWSDDEGECSEGSQVVTRTWTAVDDCGNMTTAAQQITLTDSTPPPFDMMPGDLTVECGDDTDPGPMPTATGTATAGDDDCGDVTIDYSDIMSDGCGDSGVITRTWTATDDCGNSATHVQMIEVDDTTPPELTIPDNEFLECGDATTPDDTGTATGTDGCGSATISWDDVVVFGCGASSTIERTWTATDDCGNESSLTQLITLLDTTPPVLTVPDASDIDCADDQAPGMMPTAATGTASVEDDCGGEVMLTYSDSEEGVECGSFTRTWTATDECGNSTMMTQDIMVTDTTAPTLSVPGDMEIECDEDSEPPSTGTATADDDCDDEVTIDWSDSEAPGCGETGVITRTWTAMDNCGNMSMGTQVITVIDTTAPDFTSMPIDTTVECGDDTGTGSTGTAMADDGCGDATVSVDDSIETPTECVDNVYQTITRTFTAMDECGNSTSYAQTITVEDTTPPMLSLPADAFIGCGDATTPDGDGTGTAMATDTCAAPEDVTISFSDSSFSVDCCAGYTFTRTWTAVDSCGNSTSGEQTISVEPEAGIQITKAVSATTTATMIVGSATNSVSATSSAGPASAMDESDIPCTQVTYLITVTNPCAPSTTLANVVVTDDLTALPEPRYVVDSDSGTVTPSVSDPDSIEWVIVGVSGGSSMTFEPVVEFCPMPSMDLDP
ncbi:MAG: hypothetical protein AAF533_21760 [Acidobacteriota bacterium]